MKAWRWLRENAVMIAGILALLYMLTPIFVIALFSFNDPTGRYNFEWVGFTTQYWAHPFAITELTDALLVSIRLAFFTAIGATILGTLIAIALVRYQFFGRRAANLLIVIPMATPEVVIGASLLSFFLTLDVFKLGFQTLLIAHIMFSVSFVVIVVRSRLIGFDRRLEEAAQDLGANALTTFRKVTLPLIAPGVVSAALLSFALSIDDFVISNFNSGSTVTFPLYIFGANQRGIPVQVNVIATMLFAVTVIAMLVVIIQQRRAEKASAMRPEEIANKPAMSLPV
ncbi:MAG: ABC transporter permease [Solirubrobacterales bacterium]|nr:ABC transporter permease [Solirubrobacterales bacterium]OJU95699.1 MAG: ABC transporter permease [Solirubrobacterales bacterium 67-14]